MVSNAADRSKPITITISFASSHSKLPQHFSEDMFKSNVRFGKQIDYRPSSRIFGDDRSLQHFTQKPCTSNSSIMF